MIALVRIALSRPYTFVVLALLLLIIGPLAALRTPTDIFPDIRIPVIGVVDTNHSPEVIDYVIPGNDDSSKAVALYVRGVADAILEGRANAVQDVVEAARGGDEFVEVEEA